MKVGRGTIESSETDRDDADCSPSLGVVGFLMTIFFFFLFFLEITA